MSRMLAVPIARRTVLRLGAVGSGMLVAACQPKIVEVEKIIKETVEVEKEKIVEKEVEKVVKETVIVESAPASKPPVTIRIHTNQGDQWYGWWNKAWETNVAGWKSEHPHITPDFEPVAGDLNVYYPVIFAHVAADTLGDIVWVRGTHRSNLAWALEYNIVRDLMPLVEATNHDLDQYYPGVVKQSTWDGKFYFMPHTSEPTCPVIAYNKDYVEQVGAPEPQNDWTFDQLTEWALELTRDGVWGFHTGHAHGRTVSTTAEYRQFGATMVSEDGKTCLPEDKDVEAIARCLQWRHDLIYKHKVMGQPDPEFVAQDVFLAGKLASFICWPVMLGRLPVLAADKVNVGWILTPLDQPGAKRRSRLHEHTHALTTASEHPEEAWEFLVFHSSLEYALQGMLAGMGSTVGRPDFFHDERTLKINPNLSLIVPIMDEIEPDFFVGNYRGPEFEQVWGANYDLVMMDKLDPQAGAEKMKADGQEVLDRPVA